MYLVSCFLFVGTVYSTVRVTFKFSRWFQGRLLSTETVSDVVCFMHLSFEGVHCRDGE